MIQLWEQWRGAPVRALIPTPQGAVPVEVGRTPPLLPFAGGLAEQPACVLASFRIMDGAAARLEHGGAADDAEEEP